MILSGKKIAEEQGKGIKITPFNAHQINPNSYNLRLSDELAYYEDDVLDMKKKPTLKTIQIPEEGFLLEPGKLYLGRTVEYTESDSYVPMLEGRSSIGRLGLNIHVTAGFGDVGFSGYWTLEMHCLQPIRIYPNVEICQIYYHTINGDYELYSSGKYANNQGIQESRLYQDFIK
jgi:dCTP deaminase